YLPDHPYWLAPDHAGMGAHILTGRLPLHPPGRAGEEADVVDGELEVEVRDALRLADVCALQAGELCGVVRDHIRELVECGGALGRRGERPALEGGPRRANGAVDGGLVSP